MLTLFGPSRYIGSHRVEGGGEGRWGNARGCWKSRVLRSTFLYFNCNLSHLAEDRDRRVWTKRDSVKREWFPTKKVSDLRAQAKRAHPSRRAERQRSWTTSSETAHCPSERKIIIGVLSFKKPQKRSSHNENRI